MNLTKILSILLSIAYTHCCSAPAHAEELHNKKSIRHEAKLGQVIRWIKDVNKMTAQDILKLKQAILQHGLVVLKGQKMTKNQHLNLTKSLGIPFEVPLSFYQRPVDDIRKNITIVPVSNYWPNGTWRGGKSSNGQYWHKDGNFVSEDQAYLLSILYAKDYKQGKKGGTTAFIDGCKARQELPSELEASLQGVKFKFGTNYIGDLRNAFQEDLDLYPEIERSIIFSHPEKNSECLNMAKTKNGFLINESNEERLKVVEKTWEWVLNRPFYRHFWTEGDIIIWDNLATFHRLIPYIDEGKKREFYRTITRVQIEK